MTAVDCIWPAETTLGEAPYWCPAEKAMYWVDIDGKAILRLDVETGAQSIVPQSSEVGCIARRSNGGFVAGTNKGMMFLDRDLRATEIFSSPEEDKENTRFNDGKCDRAGRLWIGSTDVNEVSPDGALYRVNGPDEVDCVLPDVIVSNGLGWSPDDKTMYFTDSGKATIYAFDYDLASGGIENQRVFARVDNQDGFPDGLTIDAEGYVWSAHWNGGRVTRYNPNGNIDRVVHMPVPLVTSVTFGGDDLDTLYVTSARLMMSDSELVEAPLSGGLFTVATDVTGLPETPFRG